MSARVRILIVDDNPDLSRLLEANILAEYPAALVRTAEDGKDALEKMNHWRPDLMILDVVMPNLDGLKLIREIKSNPRGAKPKILAMSGLGRDIGRTALKTGADAFFKKGTSLKEIIRVLPEYAPALSTPPAA